jgi:hypothetical protein
MKDVSYGPTPEEVAQPENGTPAFELPKDNDTVTYAAVGNDLCPRGTFPGIITDVNKEPHPTEPHDNVIVSIKAETEKGIFNLRYRVSMKSGWGIQKIRLCSGEPVDALGAEVVDGKLVKFKLSKLVDRTVAVVVADDEFNGRPYTRVDVINVDQLTRIQEEEEAV